MSSKNYLRKDYVSKTPGYFHFKQLWRFLVMEINQFDFGGVPKCVVKMNPIKNVVNTAPDNKVTPFQPSHSKSHLHLIILSVLRL